MNDFKVGDPVKYVGTVFAERKGKHGVVAGIVDSSASVRVEFDGDGREVGCWPKSLRLITPAPDVITIDRADLTEIVVNEAGWVKADTNYLAHIDSAKSSNLRLIALHYLAAVEFLEAREKATEETAAAEKEAADKLTKRRDDVARELAKKAGWDAYESAVYSSHLAETQYAIDMLIAEYDRG